MGGGGSKKTIVETKTLTDEVNACSQKDYIELFMWFGKRMIYELQKSTPTHISHWVHSLCDGDVKRSIFQSGKNVLGIIFRLATDRENYITKKEYVRKNPV